MGLVTSGPHQDLARVGLSPSRGRNHDPQPEHRQVGIRSATSTDLWQVVRGRRLVPSTLLRSYFLEQEQVAFSPAVVVPGIGFTDDPLLQTRLMAYADTQRQAMAGTEHVETQLTCTCDG